MFPFLSPTPFTVWSSVPLKLHNVSLSLVGNLTFTLSVRKNYVGISESVTDIKKHVNNKIGSA